MKLWRRSYDVPPPPLSRDDERHPVHDDRYRDLPPGVLPDTECLADVVARMVPYWEDAIAADLRAFSGVLVVAHGNSIRALVKYLKDIPDDEIVGLEIPTGVPWWFRFDDALGLVDDRQLGDPEAIRAATEAVARQAGYAPAGLTPPTGRPARGEACRTGQRARPVGDQRASRPLSPVRTRTTDSTGITHTFPSPILPVAAVLTMASTTSSAWVSSTSTSTRILGTKSTSYSAPRYTSVWPRWRPKPWASVRVMPWTPSVLRVSLTSSSLKGLRTATTSFIVRSLSSSSAGSTFACRRGI